MKRLNLSVILLAVCLSVSAQQSLDTAIWKKMISSPRDHALKMDTFKCVMLVSDTSRFKVTTSTGKIALTNNQSFTVEGYVVMNGGYLDRFKKPISTKWVVWISMLTK